MYCSASSLPVSAAEASGEATVGEGAATITWGDHLGWPKQRDGSNSVGVPPADYGAGFAKLGLLPPPWTQPAARGDLSAGPGECGTTLRDGVPRVDGKGLQYGLEPLMAAHNVDVYLCGHQHNYERFYPVMNGSFVQHYNNPGKPVHVVTGSGGAYSKDPFTGPIPAGDAFRSEEWSFSDIFVNRTHFWLRQRLATNGSVIDSMVLTNRPSSV